MSSTISNIGQNNKIRGLDGVTILVRLTPSLVSNEIKAFELGDKTFNSLHISHLGSFSDGGDHRPFRGQDPLNTTVLIIDIQLFSPQLGTNSVITTLIPPGGKTISLDHSLIVAITRIEVATDLDADLTNSVLERINAQGATSGGGLTSNVNIIFDFLNNI